MSLNTTGIEPTEFNVLIRLDKMADKIGSIILASETKDRKQALDMRGTLIAASPLAFSYDSWTGVDEAQKPKVGDKVIIAKGTGYYFEGKEFGNDDGEFYRLIKDKDVCAIVREPVAVKKAKAA